MWIFRKVFREVLFWCAFVSSVFLSLSPSLSHRSIQYFILIITRSICVTRPLTHHWYMLVCMSLFSVLLQLDKTMNNTHKYPSLRSFLSTMDTQLENSGNSISRFSFSLLFAHLNLSCFCYLKVRIRDRRQANTFGMSGVFWSFMCEHSRGQWKWKHTLSKWQLEDKFQANGLHSARHDSTQLDSKIDNQKKEIIESFLLWEASKYKHTFIHLLPTRTHFANSIFIFW